MKRRCGPEEWDVLPSWADVLLGPRGLRLEQWIADGRAEVVKSGARRTVYRVDSSHGPFFLKHFHGASWAAAGRSFVRGSDARREWRKTTEVARRQLPTVHAVAFGQRRTGGVVVDNYLVTEAVAGGCAVDVFLSDELPRMTADHAESVKKLLARRLAELCAAAHRAGVDQRDFHAGNVLVQFDRTTDEVRLLLIDLPTVRFSGPLSWRRSLASLAIINAGFDLFSTQGLRWQFWTHYRALRDDLPRDKAPHVDPRRAAQAVLAATRKHAQRVMRSRDKRCWRDNREFYRMGQGANRGHAAIDLPREQLRSLLEDPAAPLRQFRHAPQKLSHSSVVLRGALPIAGRKIGVAYKRTRTKRWWKRLLAPLRKNRALAGWFWGNALAQRFIPTARPLAVVVEQGGHQGYLATEWIDGSQNLHLYGWALAERSPQDRHCAAARCAEALGHLLGRLHWWGLDHRDLKGCNLVVRDNGQRAEVFLIDLDGLTNPRRLSRRARVQNLARLATSVEAHAWISKTQRLRFLRTYLNALQEDRQQWKRLWRDVQRNENRITARMKRRGKKVA